MNSAIKEPKLECVGDIFFLARSPGQAAAVIHELRASVLGDHDVSVVVHNMQAPDDSQSSHVAINAALASIAGASAGAALGWVVLGSLLAAGPLVAAIGGGALGGTAGGLLTALIGAGMPDHHAAACHKKIRSGEILVAAHPRNAQQREQVQAILAARGLTAVDMRAAQRW